MKFNNTKIFLTKEDVQQAVEYWLRKEVLSSISDANKTFITSKHTRGGAVINLCGKFKKDTRQ